MFFWACGLVPYDKQRADNRAIISPMFVLNCIRRRSVSYCSFVWGKFPSVGSGGGGREKHSIEGFRSPVNRRGLTFRQPKLWKLTARFVITDAEANNGKHPCFVLLYFLQTAASSCHWNPLSRMLSQQPHYMTCIHMQKRASLLAHFVRARTVGTLDHISLVQQSSGHTKTANTSPTDFLNIQSSKSGRPALLKALLSYLQMLKSILHLAHIYISLVILWHEVFDLWMLVSKGMKLFTHQDISVYIFRLKVQLAASWALRLTGKEGKLYIMDKF